MNPDSWERLSTWHNAWLAADAGERDRLHREFVANHPDLAANADALVAASPTVGGFLDVPAIVANARTLAEEDAPLPVDSKVGPYRIVSLLARGGMGDVYRAADVRLRRDVALKILPQSAAGDARRMERFVREAQWTASLDHPNIVRLYDVGLVDGRAYFVEELLDGETLRSRLSRGALAAGEAVPIASDVARGLIAAHAAGLIHRDLKPENIFLTRSGPAKILDFGIAKLEHDMAAAERPSTVTGVVLGTSAYLAPEQIRGDAIDARADLFAFGSVLFEMLTGRQAFGRDHLVDTLHAILYEPAVFDSAPVPSELAGIVGRLLEKAPDARFQSAVDLLPVLQDVDTSIEARASERLARAAVGVSTAHRRERVRRSALQAGVAATVLVLAGATSWFYRPSARPPASDGSRTLAVFPFKGVSSHGGDDLLQIGLAEVFISRMSRIAGVRVLPLSATLRLQREDPSRAGPQLGADYVLTGTLQRASGRLRAEVKLFSVRANDIVWQDTFDGDDRVSFQDAIAGRVIEAIAPRLSHDLQRRLARAGTADREAYEAYLSGRAHVSRPNRSDLKKAVEYFRLAVGRDQGFADAWAGLALALRMLPIAGDERPVDTIPAAKAAADRALALEPDHPDALAAQGMIAFYFDWEFGEAERLVRRALSLQPSAFAHLGLAHILSNLGRHDESLTEIQRARALDPAWPLARALEGQFLFFARRYDKALHHLDQLVQFDPSFPSGHLMRLYPLLALGEYQAALDVCDRVDELYARSGGTVPGQPFSFALALRGYALAKLGDRTGAETVLHQLEGFGRERYIPPHHVALVLHALGRDDEALERLREAVEARDWSVIFLGTDPKWDELRSTPAFDALLSRANLLEVSRAIKPEQMSGSAAPSR